MREVKSHSVLGNIRACLRHMTAQNIPQCSLKQMHCRVVTADCLSALIVDFRRHGFAYADFSAFHNNSDNTVCTLNYTGIANLTAALCVKTSAVKYKYNLIILSGTVTQSAVFANAKNLTVKCVILITVKFCVPLDNRKYIFLPRCILHISSGGTCTAALLVHQRFKAIFINSH